MIILIRAAAVQLLALTGILLLHKAGLMQTDASTLWQTILLQSLFTMIFAKLLHSPPWWLVIHPLFVCAIYAALTLSIPPVAFLLVFVILLLLFWTSFKSQVPLFLSNRQAIDAVAQLISAEQNPSLRLLDVGSGTGSLLRPLARRFPDCQFVGIENAPLSHLIGRLLARNLTNLTLRRGDFFNHSWAEYDIIYAFLSPVPMAKVWQKARLEMAPDNLLISNSFEIPCVTVSSTIKLADRRQSQLWLYQMKRK